MPIREAIARLIAPAPEADPRVAELQAELNVLTQKLAKVDKRLSMTMGALQAATAQLTGLDKRVADAVSTARQASQQATTARSTAESVAEALDELEGPSTVAELDTSVLDGGVKAVREALSAGSFDEQLDALAAAERGGKSRKGVLAAIDARR